MRFLFTSSQKGYFLVRKERTRKQRDDTLINGALDQTNDRYEAKS